MTGVPDGQNDAFVLGDGFLPPGKSTGSVAMVTRTGAASFSVAKLTSDKSGWFYHRIVWADVNADGRPDIVTARAYDSVFSGAQGELLWLEAPHWAEHHIASGPDINFDIYFPTAQPVAPFVVYAAEFFGEQVTAYAVDVGGSVKQVRWRVAVWRFRHSPLARARAALRRRQHDRRRLRRPRVRPVQFGHAQRVARHQLSVQVVGKRTRRARTHSRTDAGGSLLRSAARARCFSTAARCRRRRR